MPLFVHVTSREKRTVEAQGENSNSLTLANHLVTDDFGVHRRKALAELVETASNPANGPKEGASAYAGDCLVGKDRSFCTSVASPDNKSALLGSPAMADEGTQGWRLLRHEESFRVPLDDHVSFPCPRGFH